MKVIRMKELDEHKMSLSSKFKKWFYDIDWIPVRIYDFIVNWIFPGYKFKRIFGFDRYDIVKCGVGRYDYADTTHRILHANMNLLCQFVDSGQLKKAHFDEEYRYVPYLPFGESENDNEYINLNEDVTIEDDILEIYNWWKIERPKLKKESEYFLHFWCEMFCYPLDECFEEDNDGNYLYNSKHKNPTLEELKNSSLFNSEYIYKYISDNELTDENKVINVHRKIDNIINYTDKKMLIKLMEIRENIWEP